MSEKKAKDRRLFKAKVVALRRAEHEVAILTSAQAVRFARELWLRWRGDHSYGGRGCLRPS